MSKTPSEWMELALAQAQLAKELDEVPVGALVVKDNEVVSVGFNVRELKQDPLGHAEIVAIKEACRLLGTWRLDECELYVTLEPCPMCLGAIQQSRFKKVYFGAKDPKGGALSLGYLLHQDARTNHRFEVDFLDRAECGKILSDFFKNKRQKK